MEKSIIGGRRCIVELEAEWTIVQADIKDEWLIQIVEKRKIVRWERISIDMRTESQTAIFVRAERDTEYFVHTI